jgi:hypothetical protein
VELPAVASQAFLKRAVNAAAVMGEAGQANELAHGLGVPGVTERDAVGASGPPRGVAGPSVK